MFFFCLCSSLLHALVASTLHVVCIHFTCHTVSCDWTYISCFRVHVVIASMFSFHNASAFVTVTTFIIIIGYCCIFHGAITFHNAPAFIAFTLLLGILCVYISHSHYRTGMAEQGRSKMDTHTYTHIQEDGML